MSTPSKARPARKPAPLLSALALALVAGGVALPPSALAVDTYWTAAYGDWNVADNWSAGVPAAGQWAVIGNAEAWVNYVNPDDPWLGALVIDSDNVDGSFATLQHFQDSLSTSALTVGDTRFGQIIQRVGTLNAGSMVVGYWAGGEGGHDMGSALLNAASLMVGRQGKGSFLQGPESMVMVSGGMSVGAEGSGSGYYEMSGNPNLLQIHDQFTVGASGNGSFVQQGGVVDNTTNALYLGEYATGFGKYELYDGQLNTAGIGLGEWGGTGEFYQYGGTVNVTHDLGIARQNLPVSSTGRYELHGGQLHTGSARVGINGTGSFLQYGGQAYVAGDLNIGSGAGSGRYELDDLYGAGDVELNADVLRIGDQGLGSFLQKAGTINVGTILVIAENPGVKGGFRLEGGSLNTPAQFVGDSGQGSFVQTGGVNNAGDLVLAVYGPASGEPVSEGRYRLEGGELHSTAARIGNEGHGHFVQTGGTHAVANEVILAHMPGSEGVYELQGGQLTATTVFVNEGGRLIFSGGELQANVENRGHAEVIGDGERIVQGAVYNEGTWKVTHTLASYAGTFTNAGAYVSDPSVSSFVDLVVLDTGYLAGGPGDQFHVSGRLESHSTQNTLWFTQNSQLFFVGGGDHDFYITGADLGRSMKGYEHNFGWGDLELLDGSALFLIDGNGNPGGALYVGTLSGLEIVGDTVTNIHGNGLNVYYAPWANPHLGGLTYALADGGQLAPVPESETWAMLLAGLSLLGLRIARASRRDAPIVKD